MTPLFDLVTSARWVGLGWILLVILIETMLLGGLFAIWRLVRPDAGADERYRAGLATLGAAIVFAALTPIGLRAVTMLTPASVSAPAVVELAQTNSSSIGSRPAGLASGWSAPSAEMLDATLGAAGLLWVIGVAALGARMLGGAALTFWVRRRSEPLSDDYSRVAAALEREWPVAQSIRVVQSSHVEAPAIMGWPRATMILPSGVISQMAPRHVEALLVHEFAHVARHDYIVNLVQSAIDVLLFFSPPVIWVSRQVREVREYCCDDVAVGRVGDRRAYVDALVTLASLNTVRPTRPALGAAGPRLILRVRRLLQEDPMPKFRRIRAAGLTLALGVLVLVGWRVVGASAAHPALAPAREALSPAVSGTQTTLPFGYGAAEGSGVELTSPTVTPANPLERITVRNVTREPITAVRFVAVLERWPAGRAVDEVEIVSSDLLSVSIPPSASLEFANVPFPPQLVRATSSGDRIQAFFSVQELHFGNGATWSIVPNPNGRNHREALAFPPADLTREFLTKQQTQASPGSVALCYDQNAREYSQGAVVGIRNEPGRTAQCKAGRWEESAP